MTDADATSNIAAQLREAGFVRLFAHADGDSLAASGVLARALNELGLPFQVSVVETREEYVNRSKRVDEAVIVPIGIDSRRTDESVLSAIQPTDRPTSVTAFEIARDLGVTPDAVLALAGAIASGAAAGADDTAGVLDAAVERGVEQRPGVGLPIDDLSDGLAHSTLFHAPYSGRPEAVQATLAELALPAELDADAHRRIASMVALDATDVDEGQSRAAEAIEGALSPYTVPDGPFATVEGYADVLSAVASDAPGTGIALALGHDARLDALSAWRTHAAAVHDGLRNGTTGRYDGLFVARVEDGPVRTTARLLLGYRSPEPIALAVSDDEAGVAAADEAGVAAVDEALASAIETTGGEFAGTDRRGYARFDGETKAFIAAFRGTL
ncbi:exonuclease RecJ [Natranaeroarchaeum sulfidigenes]|uniref:Protein similar to exonuclease RecJ central domain predicted to be involved in DNA replication initiation n=1 Tax=Natranaeroarchaeum sulfidigenes TaxID=2784880 RepID=A0A897MSG1_9EURY|nr:exonuclease RecJ [Natranaeroarchaeum sulfidigenes]QSG03231.1 Protein similar to exonuclease RecJ central domain predicted to be involved in DNA replication initiation [Natranaeroarchaeum sulfidigenes]